MKELAYALAARLSDYPECIGCEVAGSIRRGKTNPKDIELCALVEPERNLFGDVTGPTPKLMDVLAEDFQTVKRGHRYAQFKDPETGWKIDFFQTEHPDAWGGLFVIRTGPAAFGEMCLRRWKWLSKGGKSVGNRLQHPDGTIVPARTEQEYFDALKMPFIEPTNRGKLTGGVV